MTIRELIIKLGYNVDKSSKNEVENNIKSIKSFATKMLGTIAIGFSLVKMNALAEEFNGINDKIKNATRGLGEQEDIQARILKAANETRTSYANTASVVSNLAQNSNGVFGNLDEAIEFNNLTTKLFKTAGKADGEIASLQEAINKSFAKGTVEAETLNQLIEKSPEAVKLLNKQLDTSTKNLVKMASDGKISLSTLKNAFMNSATEINKDFEELDYSISDAMLNIRNQWGLFCDSLWTGSGVANGIGKMMVKAFTSFMDVLKKLQPLIERVIKFLLTGVQKAFNLITRVGSFIGQLVNKIGGIEQALKLVAIVAGAVLIAFNAKKVMNFLSGALNIIKLIGFKLLPIIAIIVLLALIVEDFINFMKGNDSVIGALFEKAGIDADKARETIIGAWNKVKDFLIIAWNFIKTKAEEIWNRLKEFWAKNGESIKENLIKIWGKLKDTLSAIWNFIKKIAMKIFNTLKAFWDTWGSTVMSVFKTIWNTLIALIQPFIDFCMGLLDFLTGVFSGDWSKVWESIKEMIQAIWDAIVIIITGVWDVIKTIFSTALDEVWGIIVDIFTAIKDFISNTITGIKDGISETFGNILDGISDIIGNIKDTIVEGLTVAIDWIKELPSQALQWGGDIINGIANGITGAISKVTDAVKGVGDKIKSFLHFSVPDEGPLTDYESWMPDFMDGLAKGIESNEDTVVDKIKGFAGKIKSFLHFSVPDEGPLTDYETWMPDFMSGLAKGIDANKDTVLDKVRSLTQSIAMLTQAATAKAQTALNSTVNNTSSNVTQNVNISNSYTGGERQTQSNVSKAMNKSAEDATTYMAKGLAYAR